MIRKQGDRLTHPLSRVSCWPDLTTICVHNREKLEFMERLSLLLYAVMAYFQVSLRFNRHTTSRTHAHTHTHHTHTHRTHTHRHLIRGGLQHGFEVYKELQPFMHTLSDHIVKVPRLTLPAAVRGALKLRWAHRDVISVRRTTAKRKRSCPG